MLRQRLAAAAEQYALISFCISMGDGMTLQQKEGKKDREKTYGPTLLSSRKTASVVHTSGRINLAGNVLNLHSKQN